MTYREVFPRKAFLPVIHVKDKIAACANAALAKASGADGIFLINHEISAWKLREIYHRVREQHPDWWIGLNTLDESPEKAFENAPPDISGIWTDGLIAGFKYRTLKEQGWKGLYFGGVAFKYRPAADNEDLEFITRAAMGCADALVTSGEQTGVPPSAEKIELMRGVLGPTVPLLIASGIAAENVDRFPGADGFLVWSSISRNAHLLDEAKTRALAGKIHECALV